MKNSTKQQIYKLYSDTLLLEGRRITLREIADKLGISHQRVSKQIDAMEKEGYLIRIKHRRSQPMWLPKDFIEKYNKSSL
jgi:DNA-binding MarR family transcriptional regulator